MRPNAREIHVAAAAAADSGAPIRELSALIGQMGVPVLPLHRTLEDPEPGRMRADWTIGGDHPSVEGYRRLGELAFKLP